MIIQKVVWEHKLMEERLKQEKTPTNTKKTARFSRKFYVRVEELERKNEGQMEACLVSYSFANRRVRMYGSLWETVLPVWLGH